MYMPPREAATACEYSIVENVMRMGSFVCNMRLNLEVY